MLASASILAALRSLSKGVVSDAAAVVLLIAVLAANLWWSKPLHNWDLVVYVGAAVSYEGGDAATIHKATWDEIRQRVSPEKYALLSGESIGHGFRIAVANDPESFIQQIPLAAVKPLYPVLMYAVGQFGVNLLTASVLISASAYCLIGLLCFIWLRKHYSPLIAAIIAACLVSMPFVQDLSILSTPDALSVLFLLLGFYLASNERHQRVALGIFLFAILARPDNVLLALAVSAVGYFLWDGMRKSCVIAAILAILIVTVEMLYAGMYDWSTTFHHAFIEHQLYPASSDVTLTISEYLHVLARSSHPWKIRTTSYDLILIVFLSLLTLRLIWARTRERTRSIELLLAALLYAGAHWLLIPNQKDRLLADFYLLVLITLAIEVQNHSEQSKSAESRISDT